MADEHRRFPIIRPAKFWGPFWFIETNASSGYRVSFQKLAREEDEIYRCFQPKRWSFCVYLFSAEKKLLIDTRRVFVAEASATFEISSLRIRILPFEEELQLHSVMGFVLWRGGTRIHPSPFSFYFFCFQIYFSLRVHWSMNFLWSSFIILCWVALFGLSKYI